MNLDASPSIDIGATAANLARMISHYSGSQRLCPVILPSPPPSVPAYPSMAPAFRRRGSLHPQLDQVALGYNQRYSTCHSVRSSSDIGISTAILRVASYPRHLAIGTNKAEVCVLVFPSDVASCIAFLLVMINMKRSAQPAFGIPRGRAEVSAASAACGRPKRISSIHDMQHIDADELD